ncbi:sulfatase-like hydrolase/transferase [Brucella sp. BE17]|uniref:sulfatase family protein n=1 Tax=Brucella sp. BE17 TaxID=3142977 RepID=UPI0031BAE915
MRKPNILWICTDQQRWDTLSCLGFAGARTPNIDALAKKGVAFKNAYTQSPICTPSRSSFLTGMYPIAHQVQRNGNDHFPPHLKLVPTIFQDAGYRTGLIGKLHLSAAQNRIETRPNDGYDEFYWSQHPNPDWPEGHDYHNWMVEKGVDPLKAYAHAQGAIYDGVDTSLHQTTWAKERAQDFMTRSKDEPWMLSINLFDPHPPFDPPKEYMDRVDPDSIPDPIFAHSDIEHQKRFTGVDQQAKVAVDPTIPYDPAAPTKSAGQSHDTPPASYDAKRIRAAYFAMIELIDDMVGELMATLDDTGQRQDTLVIFMSDHGEMLGDHGLLYKGCRFYEGLVHVPLIISYPGRSLEDVKSDALVELVDLPSTLLEAAELPVPFQNQGRSLLPLLTGKANLNNHKPYVLSEFFDALGFPGGRGSRGSMYFDGRYKLNVYHDANEGELFDLERDPQEFDDHWNDPAYQAIKLDLMQKHFSAMMVVSGAGPQRIADF